MYHLAGLETRSPVLVQFDHMVIEEGNANTHRQKGLRGYFFKGKQHSPSEYSPPYSYPILRNSPKTGQTKRQDSPIFFP